MRDSAKGGAERTLSRGHPWVLLAAMVLIYTALFTWIAYSKYACLESTRPQDLAAHSQAIWNTAHGRFLQQSVLYIGGLNHFFPLLALFAPLVRLSGSILPLFLLYTLILALGGIAVYLLAEDRLGSQRWALLAALFYLAFPGLHYVNLMDLKPIILSVPLLLLSFLFWERGDFVRFLAALMVTSLTTEQIAPVIATFGLLSWVRGRDWRWIASPPLIAVFVLAFSIYIYVPWASGAPYKHIRDHRFFSDIRLFSWHSYEHIFSFSGLGAIFFLLSGEGAILAIPYVPFGVFTKSIYTHYYFPLVAILFIAFIYVLARVGGWREGGGPSAAGRRQIWLAALAFLAFIALDPFLIRPKYHYRLTPSDRAAWSLMHRIPPEASVSCDRRLLPALSLRERVHEFARKEYHGQRIDDLDVDYILIDPRGPRRPIANREHYQQKAQRLLLETLQGSSGFEIASREGDWVLFRRKETPDRAGGHPPPPPPLDRKGSL